MLIRGHGVDVDANRGMRLMRRADDRALYVARLVLDGDREAELLTMRQTFAICEMGYSEDDPRAVYSYTKRLEVGRGVKRLENKKKLFKAYMRSAKAGDPGGQYEVGQAYLDGTGVDQDLEKALKWLHMARDGGSRSATFRLAYVYSGGSGVAKNDGLAFKLYSEIAEDDDSAMNNLANYYYDGGPVEKDREKACRLYLRSAQQGSAVAMKNLAASFQQGEGVIKDMDLAIHWYARSAELGNKGSALELVKIYKNERVDVHEESYWMEVAAENGSLSSMREMALRYRDGTGVRASNSKSYTWAVSYLNRMPVRSRVTANQYNTLSCVAIALSNPGWPGHNPNEAAEMWKSISNYGYFDPLLNLAKMHTDGAFEKANPSKGVKLYKKAYEIGKDHNQMRVAGVASLSIAHCYKNGVGVKTSLSESVAWLERSVAMHWAAAAYELAMLHFEGETDAVDRKRAISLMGRAAAAKYAPAMFWFAKWHLERGEESQAVNEWLKKLARSGNAKARRLLREYGIPYAEPRPESNSPDEDEQEESEIIDLGIASLGHDGELHHGGLDKALETTVSRNA